MMPKINNRILFLLYETNQITEAHLEDQLLDKTGKLKLEVIDKEIVSFGTIIATKQ